jgi:hypothetical protein
MTQHQKIIELHRNANWGWVCGNAYRAEFIFSPHKRRDEIEKEGIYEFWRDKNDPDRHGRPKIGRKCIHGQPLVRDYLLLRRTRITLPPAYEPKKPTTVSML